MVDSKIKITYSDQKESEKVLLIDTSKFGQMTSRGHL